MNVDVKDLNEVQRELSFEIPRERVTKTLDEVYKNIGRKAKIKGFRPGKVPRRILEKEFRADAEMELIKKLIPEVYQEGVEAHAIQPVARPDIKDVSYKDGLITFKAVVDVQPEIKITKYKGIKVKRKKIETTEEELNQTLEYFKKGQPQDKEVKIDDTFARSLGYPDLEDFKRSLRRQLEIDKDRQARADVENQVIEALLKATKFTVPPSLVKEQVEHALKHEREQWQRQGLSGEDMRQKETEARKALQEPCERQVKVYLILNEIAKLENIVLGENENFYHRVMEFLLKEAEWA